MRLRSRLARPAVVALGFVPLVVLLLVWFGLTAGATVESRVVTSLILPSPAEMFGQIDELWFDKALMRSLLMSGWRVLQGFLVASAVALPLGIAMGAWTPVRAVFNPVMATGGYLPIAALVPLTLVWFGTNETQKVAFLALASFVVLLPMVVQAIDDVDDIFLKTAYTLGASPWQTTYKVLVPIAAAAVWDGLRMAMGVGWTYIVLAEIVDADRGLGHIIITSQRRGNPEHVYLVLAVIILVAFGTDLLMSLAGRAMFPYRRAR